MFSPPRGPFWSVGHTASRLRQNPVEPQSYFRSHISCSSSGTSKPNSSWCRFPPQAHWDPPLRGAAPLNSPRSKKVPGKKKSGQLFAQSSQLKPPQCQELSWFRSLALVSYLLATSSWNTVPFYFTEGRKKTSREVHVQVLSCFIGVAGLSLMLQFWSLKIIFVII